jgi:hypothetical protein
MPSKRIHWGKQINRLGKKWLSDSITSPSEWYESVLLDDLLPIGADYKVDELLGA